MKQLTATPKVILLITVLVALGSWQAARIGAQSPQAATTTSKVRSAAIVLTVSTASGGNLCASDTSNSSVVIDNSLTNGNPNAVIVATLDIGNSSNLRFPMPGPLYLFYDDSNSCGNASNKWVAGLINASFGDGEKINLMITAP